MSIFRNSKFLASLICLGLLLTSLRAMAEDVDLFTAPATSAGVTTVPNVMIVLDNSTTDLYLAKVQAIKDVLPQIGNMNVGLALWVQNGSPHGAYVRLGAKSMGVSANLNAYLATLDTISIPTPGHPSDPLSDGTAIVNGADKEETEAYYEMYKYYSVLQPYAGKKTISSLNANNKPDPTAFNADGSYNPPAVPTCGNDVIIYIAANNSFDITQLTGKQTYETPPGSVGPQLPGSSGSQQSWADEWTHYLYANKNPQISSYVIDVATSGNGDTVYTGILQDEAQQGGGKWIPATDRASIKNALLKIFGEIQAVNSTFASVSLPVNTTNRAQNKNQVFIPQFRPNPKAKPRWMGNLKQYQLTTQGSSVVLGDSQTPSQPAVNSNTGFLTDCAISFWTTDSINYTGADAYWKNVASDTSTAGGCLLGSVDKYSDQPDGPLVEKGGVAEVIRKGNWGTQDWKEHRNIWTQPAAGGTLAMFSGSSPDLDKATGLSSTTTPTLTGLANFIRGWDVNLNEMSGRTDSTLTRPSLHGDAIHSRPLPVDYGATGVTVYYGSNDGTLRSVDSATGQERWAFVAPEFFSRLQRLKDNSPPVKYPGSTDATATPKDYFFDGSIGVYQNANNTSVSIYPTMRRGGRMIYAFDVTDPATPKFKWKVGCPNLGDDSNCTKDAASTTSAKDFSFIGQTWSIPNATSSLLGYKDASTGNFKPVLIVGGGYDKCEDTDNLGASCSTPKGAGVYVIDADTGALVKSFPTLRSVAADVSLLGLTTPGVVDHAYAADTGGNLYRIDFDADQTKWAINRVASASSSAGRKFLYPPALLPTSGNQVYVAIGSGDREHPLKSIGSVNTAAYGVTNRFYVYRDDLTQSTAINLDDTTTSGVMCDFSIDTSCSPSGIFPTSTKRGWFINLPGKGEQAVTSAVIAAGMVTFSTNMPNPTPPTTMCTPDLGVATGYWLNLLNASGAIGVTGTSGGARSALFVGGGLPPSPVLATVPIKGTSTTVIIGAPQRSGGASCTICPQKVNLPITPKRKSIYWKSSGEN